MLICIMLRRLRVVGDSVMRVRRYRLKVKKDTRGTE